MPEGMGLPCPHSGTRIRRKRKEHHHDRRHMPVRGVRRGLLHRIPVHGRPSGRSHAAGRALTGDAYAGHGNVRYGTGDGLGKRIRTHGGSGARHTVRGGRHAHVADPWMAHGRLVRTVRRLRPAAGRPLVRDPHAPHGGGRPMMRPSRLSASYASLLPALNRLGYRADVREASVYGSRCMVVVSGAPTTRVLNDGSWKRDDGMSGPDPAGLLALYRDERAHMAVRNLARHDLKGVARDILVAEGLAAQLCGGHLHDGGLAVSYRRVEGVPEDTVIDDWMARAKAAPALLEEIA